jgi:hypothetical protein
MNEPASNSSRTAPRARRIAIVALWVLGAAGASVGTAGAGDVATPTGQPPDTATRPARPEEPLTVAPSAPKLSVEEILSRYAKARGGLPAWHKIQTMVQIGRIERGQQVPGAPALGKRAARLNPDEERVVGFRLELARPNKMRLELEYQGATAIQAFDGVTGYTVQPAPSGTVARPFSEAQTRVAAEQQDLEGPLLDAAARRTVVKLDGVDAVGARPAYKLALALKSGVTRHVWVDAETFLDLKIDGTRQFGDRTWPVETFFSDFRKVGNVLVPYQIQTSVGGVHTMERIVLAKVIVNAPLEGARFTLPRAPEPTPGEAPTPASRSVTPSDRPL